MKRKKKQIKILISPQKEINERADELELKLIVQKTNLKNLKKKPKKLSFDYNSWSWLRS